MIIKLLDIVFGNIKKFVLDYNLNQYDRVGEKGHLSFFKNDKEHIELFKINHSLSEAYKFNDVMHTNFSCGYDEIGDPQYGYGLTYIMRKSGYSCYSNINEADIRIDKRKLAIRDEVDNIVFTFNEGTLLGWYEENGVLINKEYSYLHLQKRKMIIDNQLDNKNFMVYANEFTTHNPNIIQKLLEKQQTLNDKNYWCRLRISIIIKRLKTGGIKQMWIRRLYKFGVINPSSSR